MLFRSIKLCYGSSREDFEREVVAFAENSFEWNLMTYQYFPYFYGAQSRWHRLVQLTDSDLAFQNFLQAGMAKVLLPVRPGYEAQVLHFLQTGDIVSDLDTAQLSAENQAILAELSPTNHDLYEQETTINASYLTENTADNTQDETERTAPTPLTWELRVPTSLVVLCDGSDLCLNGETPVAGA